MSWLQRLETTTKALTVVRADFVPVDTSGTTVQINERYTHAAYGSRIREGRAANVIMSPVQWIMRTFPEAEPIVERKLGEKPWAHQPEHDLEALLRNPNEWYDGACLMQGTVLSYVMDGNAYWLKLRNVFGRVVELWYVPHWMMEPKTLPDDARVLYYEYTPDDGPMVPLAASEVVHLRFGLDPENPRKGLSQLKTLMREAFTDEEAAAFTATLLRNQGVPGIVVAPKNDGPSATPDDIKDLKRFLMSSHTGERRGEPLVMSAPTDIHQFGFDPNQLTLANLRDISEERVCAALGLPAAVVGFGAGLQSTKVGATMREMRRLAWVQGIIPAQLSIGRQLTKQALPDFEGMSHRWRVRFDTSEVSAFQEEETEKATRIVALVEGGVLRVDKAQEMLGLEVDGSQNVYLRPSGVTVVEEGDQGLGETRAVRPGGEDLMAEAARAMNQRRALPATNGNGNGGT